MLQARGSYDFADGTRTCHEAKGSYSTHLFAARASEIITSHNYTQPLFLYLAFQAVHWPLEAPEDVLRRFDNTTGGDSDRRAVAAMAAVLDEGVADVSRALRAVGQWDKTLLIFVSDNGGPTHGAEGTSSNNYPMRGGKNTLWEGGTRVVAAVRGAGIHPKAVGSVSYAPVHATDWLPTLLRYASGREDWEALAAELTARRRRGEAGARAGEGGRGDGDGVVRRDVGRGRAVSSRGRARGLDEADWLQAGAPAVIDGMGDTAGDQDSISGGQASTSAVQASISGGSRAGLGNAAEAAAWEGGVGAAARWDVVQARWASGLALDAPWSDSPEQGTPFPDEAHPLFRDAAEPLLPDAEPTLFDPEPPFLDGDGVDVLASILTGAHVRKEILLEAHPPPLPWHSYVRNATAPPSAQPRGFTHHPGFLLEPGRDLQPAAVVRGIGGCAGPCLADERCTAFSFVAVLARPEGDILCHWKKGEVKLIPNDYEQVRACCDGGGRLSLPASPPLIRPMHSPSFPPTSSPKATSPARLPASTTPTLLSPLFLPPSSLPKRRTATVC